MKYLKLTLIKRLLLFCCLFILTACPKHIYPNSSYSMSILNDTEYMLCVNRNFNNISMIFSAERGESETLLPGDTLILLDNMGFFDEDNSFNLAWEPVKDKDMIIQMLIIPEDLSQLEHVLYESRSTKGYDNSFFEERSWQLKKWDNAYGIHRYDWLFSIKDNLPHPPLIRHGNGEQAMTLMKYLKLTLINKLFVVFGFLALTACDPFPNEARHPSHCYSLYVLNDTDSTVMISKNFNDNLKIVYNDGPRGDILKPKDTLFLRKNVGATKNNTPFATAWRHVSDEKLYIKIFRFFEGDPPELGKVLYESKNTNGFDNSFFEEDSWQLTHWDKDPRDPYNIQHYSWEFSLKKHLP